MDESTPAERAIYDAMRAVEEMPAHPVLTEAVVMLGRARDRVADFVDGVAGQPEADEWLAARAAGAAVEDGKEPWLARLRELLDDRDWHPRRSHVEGLLNYARELREQRASATAVRLWECPACGFRFDAAHEDVGGGHSCPACAERTLLGLAASLRGALADAERERDGWRNTAAKLGELSDRQAAALREAEADRARLDWLAGFCRLDARRDSPAWDGWWWDAEEDRPLRDMIDEELELERERVARANRAGLGAPP